jgi:hypothetical protein
MQYERFGYFRLNQQGRVHYFDEVPGSPEFRALCGKHAAKARLVLTDPEEAERDLCKTCKRIIDTEFWGWEQMV